LDFVERVKMKSKNGKRGGLYLTVSSEKVFSDCFFRREWRFPPWQ